MMTYSIRAAFLALTTAFALANATYAEEKKELKIPPIDSKEWKEVKDGEGLKIWDVVEGKGDATKASATVTIHYTGWTTDGKIFDSSVERGEKATFPLDNLIKGWQKGIPGMKPGSTRRLFIPWALAYGERGRGKKIPPMADLIFEIELFSAVSPLEMPSLTAKEWKDFKVEGVEGMKVWDAVEGKGVAAVAASTVTIHYTGWTTDGKVFDSSVTRGEPATFPLGNLIKGWQLGVPGMKPGGKRRMILPHELAYGERGSPPKIPAKATLVFEIELISVEK